MCTGELDVDAVLQLANLPVATGLYKSSVFTWEGLCAAHRASVAVVEPGKPAWGEPTPAHTLVSVAALFSELMWETGREMPWSLCDEVRWRFPNRNVPHECGQRRGRKLYHELNSSEAACYVDPEMATTAVTHLPSQRALSCRPGTKTERCCWWGRGAIEIYGPPEHGEFQRDIVSTVPELVGLGLCKTPEAMCAKGSWPGLKWLSATHVWATRIQPNAKFQKALDAHILSGFNAGAPKVDGISFQGGAGSLLLTEGSDWATPPNSEERRANFKKVMAALKSAGMRADAAWGQATTIDPATVTIDPATVASEQRGRRGLGAGAVVAIVLGVCLLAGAAGLLIWRRRNNSGTAWKGDVVELQADTTASQSTGEPSVTTTLLAPTTIDDEGRV